MNESAALKNQLPGYRQNNFNILRFFGAVLVIIGHMYHILGLPVLSLGGQAISTIGVEVFFLISGYLIMQSYTRDSNVLRYAMRRFFRIIPGLAFLSFLTAFVIGPLITTLDVKTYFLNPGPWIYLRNIALYPIYNLPGVFEHNIYPVAVNGSLWTLPVEVSMYVILPIILFFGSKLKHKEITLIAFFILITVLHIVINGFYPSARVVVYGTSLTDALTLAPYFFMGSLFALPEMKKHLNLQLASVLLALSLVLQLSYVKSDLLMLVALSYFVFSFALSPEPFFAKCFSKNDYSYGIYLYAFMVQQLLASVLRPYKITLNVYLLLSFIGSFLFAFVSWHLVEKPAQDLCKKLIKGRQNQPA